MPKSQKLDNGITLVLESDPNSSVTTVLVGVPIGSNNENKDEHGLAHFFEHMCFKGTKKYPKHSDLLKEIESLGLSTNAFTSNEKTAYHLSGDAKHTEKMIHIVGEMFINSLFPAEELEKEKGVIIEEMKMYEDDPCSKSSEEAELQLLKGTEAGHRTLGSVESVKSFNRESFIDFYKRYYVAENTIIIVSGKFDEGVILETVKKIFKETPQGKETKHPVLKLDKTAGRQFTSILRKEIEQTSVAISFYSYGENDRKSKIAKLLGVILGGGMSSRLFLSIREKMGACYRIFSANCSSSNYGEFYIQTGIDKNNFEKVIKGIAKECALLKTEKISEEELQKAKQILIGRILLNTESSMGKANLHFSKVAIGNGVETIEQTIEDINQITANEIQDMANEIFKSNEMKVVVVSNKEFEKSSIQPLLNL